MGEPLAQLRGLVEVVYAQQGVVVTEIAHAGRVELAGKPFAAVHIYLDLVGQPGLHPHVHEPELGVDEVEDDMREDPLGSAVGTLR